jgi:hypothetical protein
MATATVTKVTPEVATPFVAPTAVETPAVVTDPFAAALAGVTPETSMSRTRVDILAKIPQTIRDTIETSHGDYQSDEFTKAGTPTFRTVKFADKTTADAFKAHARKYATHRTDGKISVRATVTQGEDGVYVRYAAVPFVAKPRKTAA